jgi:hypothetical protein
MEAMNKFQKDIGLLNGVPNVIELYRHLTSSFAIDYNANRKE